MKKYVYPAVVYFDEEAQVYVIYVEDLGIIVEGDTVEEAHKRASKFMDIYLTTALREELEIPEASEFEKVVANHPKEMVVMVESILDHKNRPINE